MENQTISRKLTITLLLASLIAGAFAFSPMSAHASTTKVAKASLNLTCMQTATDTREEAVMDAFEEYNSDVTAALAARKTALHDAWGITDRDDRSDAVKAAWKTWKTEKKAAHSELKTARKAAWTTFKTTAKSTCKETLPKEETLEKDTAGTIAL